MGLVVVALVVLWLFFAGGAEVVQSIAISATNGDRVGPATALDANGVVTEVPNVLAQAAGLDLETYSLARAIASEHGNDPTAICIAVAHVILNSARETHRTVVDRIVPTSGKWAGLYARQRADGRYVATMNDPHERHVQIARAVLTGAVADPTGGATHFFSPRAQDALFERGTVKRDAAAQDAYWQATGLYPGGAVPVVLADVDPRTITFYRRAA